MNKLKHICWAIRYGDWDCGCEYMEGRKRFGWELMYYDGNWFTIYVGNCNGWSEAIRNGPTPMNDKTKCGKCGQWTTWFDFGMGFTVADDKTGVPLNE